MLKIILENNVAVSVDLDLANRTIATTQMRLNNNEGQVLVKKEGGSGYLKIKNILKGNLKRNNCTLELNAIKEDRIFKSYIAFELDNLIK